MREWSLGTRPRGMPGRAPGRGALGTGLCSHLPRQRLAVARDAEALPGETDLRGAVWAVRLVAFVARVRPALVSGSESGFLVGMAGLFRRWRSTSAVPPTRSSIGPATSPAAPRPARVRTAAGVDRAPMPRAWLTPRTAPLTPPMTPAATAPATAPAVPVTAAAASSPARSVPLSSPMRLSRMRGSVTPKPDRDQCSSHVTHRVTTAH